MEFASTQIATEKLSSRAEKLFREHQDTIYRRTDRLFGWLLILEWLAGIGAALWISPKAWEGQISQLHIHVLSAIFLGAAIVILPVALAMFRPGDVITRHTIAIGQMLISALLIHLTGGRIETHFHVFGSLAFLAFYRDWRVIISASVVVASDHFLRGVYWPQSVYGVIAASQWRWLEHAGWVVFEDIFLCISCVQGVREMRAIAYRQGQLESVNETIEGEVQKRTAELKTSEERFRSLCAASPIGIFQTDAEGRGTYVNSRWQMIFGLTFEEGMGTEWNRTIHPDDRQQVLENWTHAVKNSREYEDEFRISVPGESPRWVHAHAAILLASDNKPTGYVGTVEDITGRKNAEQELRDKSAALENAVEGISRLNPQGLYISVNSAYARMLGYEPEELVGTSWHRTVHVDDRNQVEQACSRMLAEGWIELDVRGIRKNGAIFHKHLSMARAQDKEGKFIGHFCFTKDISEHRALEEQLRHSQKMDAVGQLAGGVAHDFNNILTVIIGHTDVLDLKMNSPETQKLKDDVRTIRRAGERAASLTRQLLAFSRKQVLTPTVVDVNSLVTDMDKMLRRLIGENIDLLTVRHSGLGRIKADRGQIEQVLMNLVVNARDAMPSGGKLTIETKDVELGPDYAARHPECQAGRYVMLAVSDDGTGMDAQTQARIFEPFFTTKDRDKGTGLGLATVYGIVQQSEGFIHVYSQLEHGTTFKIYLPRFEGVDVVTALEEVAGPAGGKETVLLVEDEEDLRNLARQILEGHGYYVIAAPNAAEALDLSKSYAKPIQILVTDVIMPGMPGPELAIRLLEERHDLKVLYMSGYTDNAVIHQGVLEAEAAFLQKPFRPSDLLHKVREILDGSLVAA